MGKPLISDATMRSMYQAMQRMRASKQEASSVALSSRSKGVALQAGSESLLAALLSQLQRRDTVISQGPHPLLATALASMFEPHVCPKTELCPGSAEECAAFAAGMALRVAQKTAAALHSAQPGSSTPCPVIVALMHELPPITGVLRLIEERDLAVLLVAGGLPEPRSEAQRRLLSTKVPVLPVDRSDAVAVCRVTQEALLRARNGWGGAVIHATAMPGSGDPLRLLEKHLETRGLVARSLEEAALPAVCDR